MPHFSNNNWIFSSLHTRSVMCSNHIAATKESSQANAWLCFFMPVYIIPRKKALPLASQGTRESAFVKERPSEPIEIVGKRIGDLFGGYAGLALVDFPGLRLPDHDAVDVGFLNDIPFERDERVVLARL